MGANQSALTEGRELRAEDYLRMIRDGASLDYQMCVPDATKADLNTVWSALQGDRKLLNEFAHGLVNRIGREVVRSKVWTNPLKEFKSEQLYMGASIREIGAGLVKAQSYSADKDTTEKDLLGQAVPDIVQELHHINRQDKYKVTVNDAVLRRAFVPSQGGFDSVFNEILRAPIISDEWDEFLIICKLFSIYEKNHEFYKINVPDVSNLDSTGADARLTLRKLRAAARTLTFLSTEYNAKGMPTLASPDELILFCTPEFEAAIDVEALAGAFNMDRMTPYGRIITIPADQLDVYGAQAILTTNKFFVMADTVLENTSFANPDGLYQNFWLHHHGIYSVSPFAPAIMFTTEPGTREKVAISPVTSVSTPVVQNRESETVTEVLKGENYWASAKGKNANDDDMNTEVFYSITGGTDPRTRIDENGVIHIGDDETAYELTVIATSAWVDPSTGKTTGKSAQVKLTVVGNTPPEPEA